MSKDFFDGRFNIKKIKYEKILKDFNIYKFGIDTKDFYNEDRRQANVSNFFRKIKNLENIKSFYLKGNLYLLGNKNFKVKESIFTESFRLGDIEEINNTEILKNIDELIILNLLLKYIPYKVFEKNAESINYTDTGSLYLFLKKEKNKIFRFFKCSLEKSKISEDYLLSLTQSTFAPEELFLEIEKNKLKKSIKLGFDKLTRVLIPNEKGNYYQRVPLRIKKQIRSNFIVENSNQITELRSYYFTLVKEIIEEYLSKYITLKFKTLKNFELYPISSNKSYFSSKIKKLSKEINVYRIKDIDIDNNELIAKDDFIRLNNYIKYLGFNNIKLTDKGIASIDTIYENPVSWNIFLLNDVAREDFLYDGYKEMKRNNKILSNGLCLENLSLEKDKESKAVIIRVLEELFIKEAVKNKDISHLHSKYEIFRGITCFLYKNEKIGKMIILEKGKIEIETAVYPDTDKLNIEFNNLIEKFGLKEKIGDKKKRNTLEIKIIRINNKDIYIFETGMRLYFDSNEFVQEYREVNENLKEGEKKKSVARGLNSFLGMSMSIRLNRKENLYYSFYDTGINSKEKFSPNIKKLICQKKLADEDYFLFCESLVFKYLSNGSKLSTYPFFFKLLSEILLNVKK